MKIKPLSSYLALWTIFINKNMNCAALRLLFQQQSGPEICAAVEWESMHR